MPVSGSPGSKSNPGGISGRDSGQSMGQRTGGGGDRGGSNFNAQGARQGREGSLGTTKAQVAKGVAGQRINSPATNPFGRAAMAAGTRRDPYVSGFLPKGVPFGLTPRIGSYYSSKQGPKGYRGIDTMTTNKPHGLQHGMVWGGGMRNPPSLQFDRRQERMDGSKQGYGPQNPIRNR